MSIVTRRAYPHPMTSGHVLTSRGPSLPPVWAAPAAADGGALTSTFYQDVTPPEHGVAILVPADLVLHRHVYGHADVYSEDEVPVRLIVEVETGIGTDIYSVVQEVAIGVAGGNLRGAFSFKVKPGHRYKFDIPDAGAIDHYSYEDV